MVNLGADIAATLPFLRAQAESRMSEVFQFFTRTVTPNEDTLEDDVTETEIARVPGRLKVASNVAASVESGGQFPVVERLEVHVPVDAVMPLVPSPWLLPGELVPSVSVPVGTFVRCIDSSVDASLIGREFRVAEMPSGGQVTARRMVVEEVS